MKILLGQINPTVGDLEFNFKKIVSSIKEAKEAGASLLVLPELSLIGYPPKDLILKSGLIEKQSEIINELKLYTDDDFAIIVGGISENKNYGRKLYNSLFCIAQGEVQCVASKLLLPSYDVFDELRYFEPAQTVTTWNWQGIKLGLSICEDIWIEAYPSLYSRNPLEELLAAGAELIINASASPYAFAKAKARQNLIQSLAIQYAVPILYVNQVGANDQLVFDGSSFVFDSAGNLLDSAKAFLEDSIVVDSESLKGSEKAELPGDLSFRSEHILDELNLEELEEIESALVLGLKDYVSKCGFSKVVLGLSGGIDSALVACIAAKALGAENVYAYMLPSEFTSKESLDDAKSLAENLGINYQIVSIATLHNEIRNLIPELSELANENVQPRLRANILMAEANTRGAILLATGNKSEIAVGYSTLYGDTCGAIAVIGDVLKTTVYQLAKFINRDKEVIPRSIIEKPPSAELRPDQKDTDSLPEYEVLDQIIFHYVQEFRSAAEIIAKGLDAKLVKQILNMIDRAEYKRQQAPPIIKIAGKAFGLGRRMPIAQGFIHK